MELTKRITGYFDVKKYEKNKPKEQWKTAKEGDTISFTVSYLECPEEFKEYARESTNDKGTRYYVTFKISERCKWYNERAELVEKPTNIDLDTTLKGQKFEVQIQYNTLHGTPGANEAMGYWANAIQFREVVEVVFTPWVASEAPIKDEPIEEAAQFESMSEDSNVDDLPF